MNLRDQKHLLNELTKKYPPQHRAHYISLRTDGRPGLMIVMAHQDRFTEINLEDEDLDKSWHEVLADVESLIQSLEEEAKTPPTKEVIDSLNDNLNDNLKWVLEERLYQLKRLVGAVTWDLEQWFKALSNLHAAGKLSDRTFAQRIEESLDLVTTCIEDYKLQQ